jgi:5-methylcytosine-specific restriction endonuclease McrA
MGRFRKRYEQAISSPHWRRLSLLAWDRSAGACEKCGRIKTPESLFSLSLHHVTYERIGRELLSDVLLLCPRCHRDADFEREDPSSPQSRKFAERLDVWATERFGADWYERADAEKIIASFEDL